MTWDCFISYAAEDLAIAEALHASLVEAGLTVWFDKVRLMPGFNWHRKIEHACELSRVLLPIVTPRWKLSEWTRFETYGAEAVIPLLAEGAWEDVATPPLQRFQHYQLRSPDDRLFAAIRRRLEEPPLQKGPRLAHLKYRPNPHFVGRDNALIQLHEGLHRNPTAALTQGQVGAIVALGGVGKTTIAREYAEKFWRPYQQLLWVDCRSGLEGQFAGLVEILTGRSGDPELKQAQRAALAYRELNRPGQDILRLLILDNAENEDSVRPWIPTTGNCHTLITSRFTAWSPGVETYPVSVLDPVAARELLLRRAGRETSDGDASELARTLGYLPLALEQAAAYIHQQGPGFGFTEYLKLYAAAERELLAKLARGGTEYPDAVYTTWRTTVDRLSAGSIAMLRLSAFMADAPIPFRMFLSGADVLAEQIAGMTGAAPQLVSEFDLREWRAALVNYSMVTPQPGESFSVHALVQAVERAHVGAKEREGWVKQAVRLITVYAPTPSDSFENWPVWNPLLPHALALAHELETIECSRAEAALLDEIAKYQAAQGDYLAAEPLYRRALVTTERELGPENYSTLAVTNNLAIVLSNKGDYTQAEKLFRRILEIRERRLGLEHIETLNTVTNLGDVLFRKGEHAEAERLIRRSVQGRERLLGAEHPITLGSVNNLAVLLKTRGDYASAEPLYRRLLESFERIHGPEHPTTLLAMNNLGNLLRNQGSFDAAEPFVRRSLELRARVLGPEHPTTLSSAINLGNLQSEMGRSADAEALYRKTLEVLDRTLGRDHPTTLTCVNNLGANLTNAGNYAAAEEFLNRALDSLERTLGPEHPQTIAALANLGALLSNKGDPAGAKRLFERALPIAEKVMGTKHPMTLMIRSNLLQQ
jgi:tetratricopeptide (TPR) repeat protein